MNRLLPCAVLATLALGSAAPASAVDLEPIALEVTQSVQDLANSVPLLERKRTVVRFHVRVDGVSSVDGVGATLEGFRIGSPGEPLGSLAPVNGPISVEPSPSRAAIGEAFLFELPPSWRHGNVELTAAIDPENGVRESDEGNNTSTVDVTFEAAPPLRVALQTVDYPGGMPPTLLDVFSFWGWLVSAYPTSSLIIRNSRPLVVDYNAGDDRCNCGPRDMNGNCTMSGTCNADPSRNCRGDGDCGCGRMNLTLLFRKIFDYLPSRPTAGLRETRYYAMVHDAGGFMRGCAVSIPGDVASGPTGSRTWGWDLDGSYGDWYGAHELAHTLGRAHAECCGAGGGVSFPYARCELGPDGSGPFGFDTTLRKVYAPPVAHDLMSYCDDQWVSDFTYSGLRTTLDAEADLPPPSGSGQTEERLVVAARVNLDLPAGELEPVWQVKTELPPLFQSSQGGEFTLELLDGQGQLAASFAVTPMLDVDDSRLVPPGERPGPDQPHQLGTIFEELPSVPGVARIDLRYQGNLLDSLSVSPGPPGVVVQAPNGGEQLGRTFTVSWKAFDQDPGSELRAAVLFSPDGGRSWHTLAVGLEGSSFEADLERVPRGSDSLIRVMVTDGYHTASDVSDAPFATADAPPELFVLNPQPQERFPEGQPVSLEAFVTDPEDGPLDGDAVVWHSSRDGVVGQGAATEFAGLEPGTHEITAEASDSGGNTVSSTPIPVVVPGPGRALSLAVGALALVGLRARQPSN